MPRVDATKIPAPVVGFGVERTAATSEQPSNSDGTGAFRTVCDFSHMNFDDAIVYPGQPGISHLHTYFGNTGAKAGSTADSIANSGNSTCRGGILNRSAYWVPAIIDTRTATPVKPDFAHIYYKTGYLGIAPSSVSVFPTGLRMIAGNAKSTGPQANVEFVCSAGGARGPTIQNCAAGDELWAEVDFPQCWDGRNLDSPDHKSHMSVPINGRCPSTHPVAGPLISIIAVYKVTESNSGLYWRASSDNYTASNPGGYSMHADWFNGWKPDAFTSFAANCLKPAKDCHSHLLGDGRAIY